MAAAVVVTMAKGFSEDPQREGFFLLHNLFQLVSRSAGHTQQMAWKKIYDSPSFFRSRFFFPSTLCPNVACSSILNTFDSKKKTRGGIKQNLQQRYVFSFLSSCWNIANSCALVAVCRCMRRSCSIGPNGQILFFLGSLERQNHVTPFTCWGSSEYFNLKKKTKKKANVFHSFVCLSDATCVFNYSRSSEPCPSRLSKKRR